jgi:glycosyltransferase involved in cell wall biosynthesis
MQQSTDSNAVKIVDKFPLSHAARPRHTVAITSNTAWNVFNFRGGLIRALLNKGYRVVVFAPRDEHVPHLFRMGCEYAEIKVQCGGTNPLKDFCLFLRYWKLLNEYRPVALLTFTPKPNIYGAFAGMLAQVPVITNISGLGRTFIKRNWISVVVQGLYSLALKHPSKVFFQNRDDRAVFENWGYVTEAQAGVLPGSGVDIARFSPAPARAEGVPFVFVMVARMLWDKGVGEFAEAARAIKKTHPHVKFQLVGFLDVDNPSAISRTQMNEWVNEGIVEYLGSTDDVRSCFANADCVVLPSYREGTPKTLLEAASMALPIITTDTPGCRNTIDDGVSGFLCKVQDAASLAARMYEMLDLPAQARRQMGKAGRNKMERQFNECLVFNEYMQAIGTLHPVEAAIEPTVFAAKQTDKVV